MNSKTDIEKLDNFSTDIRSIEDELDRRVYHLKTLFDVSKDIFETVDIEATLKNFLMMTTGNFGVIEGFILTEDLIAHATTEFVSVGFEENDRASLIAGGSLLLSDGDKKVRALYGDTLKNRGILPETIVCVFCFHVDETYAGVLGLGSKIVGDPYSDEDIDLLTTLINNLVVAVKNARSFENIKRLNLDLNAKNVQLEEAMSALDRRVYHLKTLYDISKDIFGSVDFEAILKNFMMMIMGNFGVMDGFILILDIPTGGIIYFHSHGSSRSDLKALQQGVKQLLLERIRCGSIDNVEIFIDIQNAIPAVVCGVPFGVNEKCAGFFGLGPKLVGEPYDEDDKELLLTFVNNLIVSMKNAMSFEDIKRLNLDLQEKNVQLEKTLKELQDALRKVEILESVKMNLSKFVPTTVTRMIEKSSTGEMLPARDRDVSVLMLDIEGYTKLNERLGGSKLNEVVERYFSVFMEAIFANNGDVNETTGDGLMVIFSSEDKTTNALEALRAAIDIREKAALINRESIAISESLVVNMGINSGKAHLGAVKFDSLVGSRWTYTARGMVTNIAARIGAIATNGEILTSRSTMDRVKRHFPFELKGEYKLKNVSEEMELFAVR